MKQTKYLQLNKPLSVEKYDINIFNANSDMLDSAIEQLNADLTSYSSHTDNRINAHTENRDIHFTAVERVKLAGVEAGAQVNTVTGVKGAAEAGFRTGNISLSPADIGADPSGSSASALAEARDYTDQAASLKADLSLIDAENGIAPLNGSRKIPSANLPFGVSPGACFEGSAGFKLQNDLASYVTTSQNTHRNLADAVMEEKNRAIGVENTLSENISTEINRAKAAEKTNADAIAVETTRAKAAEKANADAVAAEATRSQAAEQQLQDELDLHIESIATELKTLKDADSSLESRKANAAEVNTALQNRYTKDQTFNRQEVLDKIQALIGTAPDTLDTFKEIADALGNDPNFAATIMNALAGKVDKASGKGLSSNDYTDAEKTKLQTSYDARHSHSNKAVLDKLTQIYLDNWNDADTKKHTHGNKAVLDKLTQIYLDNWNDANTKKHTHGNKAVLDTLTQALITKWNGVDNKVDKVTGKALSTNDYTTAEKQKLAGIAAEARVNVQSDWNVTDTASDAYIKNKPASMPASDVPAWAKASAKPAYSWTEIGSKPSAFPPSSHTHTKKQITDMPTKLSQFSNDKGFITAADVDTSQNHVHSNKTLLDAITQTTVNNWNTVANKVDKITGKGLSSNDFTAALLTKLNGIADGANKYVHPATSGNRHIPAGGSSGQILRWSADGTAAWGSDNNTTYSVFKGAAASAAGSTGLVPAPAAGSQAKYLRADGTWNTPTLTGSYLPLSGGTMSTGARLGFVSSTKIPQQPTIELKETQTNTYTTRINPGTVTTNEIHADDIFYSGDLSASSSRRYKKNITDITESQADRLMQLTPVEFDYTASGKHSQGLIAEDCYKLLPEVVVLNQDDEPEAIRYVSLIPYMLKKLQMQEKEINSLKALITNHMQP